MVDKTILNNKLGYSLTGQLLKRLGACLLHSLTSSKPMLTDVLLVTSTALWGMPD